MKHLDSFDLCKILKIAWYLSLFYGSLLLPGKTNNFLAVDNKLSNMLKNICLPFASYIYLAAAT